MSTQEQRERFEAFAIRRNMGIERISCGRYKSSFTQAMFESWLAAEAAAIERCATSVKALHARISDPSIVGDERSEGGHNALYAAEMAIRALLPKEES